MSFLIHFRNIMYKHGIYYVACLLDSKEKQIHEECVGPCQIYDAEEKDGELPKRNIEQHLYMAFTYCHKCQVFENPRHNKQYS